MSLRRLALLALAASLTATAVDAQQLATERVATGLRSPLFLASPPGDTDRLFVLEEDAGQIRIIKNGTLLPTPFLDIRSKMSTLGERGLLGLAFHPDFAQNDLFYVHYSATGGGATTIERYEVSAGNPDVADPNSDFLILSRNQPFSNHNGGMIAFGPNDGYLYIALGDGGSGGDPFNNGQRLDTWLGKILRIDVDGGSPYAIPADNPFVGVAGAEEEIWAYGLRNPWRFSFDPANGDLYIADVGQNAWEELDYQPGSSPGGENYGWKIMEGTHCFDPPQGCNTSGLVLPILEYGHTLGRCSITGGYVYRGSAIPGLSGTYFFGDYCTGETFSLRYVGAVTHLTDRTAELQPPTGPNIANISSYGVDSSGELYILDHGRGEVLKIVGDLMTLSTTPLVSGQMGTVQADDATPGQTVFFLYSRVGPGNAAIAILDVVSGLSFPQLAGSAAADLGGTATLSQTLPPATAGLIVWLQAVELGNTSNVVMTTIQ